MRVLRVALAAFCALLLAAHFFRTGRFVLVALALGVPWLLAVRAAWGARVVQAFLALGALEWVRTGIVFVAERRAAGVPWLRLALILGAVALLTAVAAWLLQPLARAAPRPIPDAS
jgi:hypothetical protein